MINIMMVGGWRDKSLVSFITSISSSHHEREFLRPPGLATSRLPGSVIGGIRSVSSASRQVPSQSNIVCEANTQDVEYKCNYQ